ncbi:elafin-like [Dasypus novemcinctus]|uniref:elafin-like n=1 Tax=Dasypus novemcinctus TaxID=9361 RepID=UPI00265F6B03|nr:elafin-like [Dasypus novemcinctus]
MRFQGVLVVSTLLVLGLLMVEAAVMKGHDTAEGPVLDKREDFVQKLGPIKGHASDEEKYLVKSLRAPKPGKCSNISTSCRLPTYGSQCLNDFDCREKEKCCVTASCRYMCLEPQ